MNWQDTTTSAAGLWNSALGFGYGLSESSTAPITLYKDNYGNVEWSGETKISRNMVYPYHVYQATIKINTYKTDGYTWDKRKNVIAHEFGHVWVLLENNDYPIYGINKSIMIGYDYTRYDVHGVITPQTDDINGVKNLYNAFSY